MYLYSGQHKRPVTHLAKRPGARSTGVPSQWRRRRAPPPSAAAGHPAGRARAWAGGRPTAAQGAAPAAMPDGGLREVIEQAGTATAWFAAAGGGAPQLPVGGCSIMAVQYSTVCRCDRSARRVLTASRRPAGSQAISGVDCGLTCSAPSTRTANMPAGRSRSGAPGSRGKTAWSGSTQGCVCVCGGGGVCVCGVCVWGGEGGGGGRAGRGGVNVCSGTTQGCISGASRKGWSVAGQAGGAEHCPATSFDAHSHHRTTPLSCSSTWAHTCAGICTAAPLACSTMSRTALPSHPACLQHHVAHSAVQPFPYQGHQRGGGLGQRQLITKLGHAGQADLQCEFEGGTGAAPMTSASLVQAAPPLPLLLPRVRACQSRLCG